MIISNRHAEKKINITTIFPQRVILIMNLYDLLVEKVKPRDEEIFNKIVQVAVTHGYTHRTIEEFRKEPDPADALLQYPRGAITLLERATQTDPQFLKFHKESGYTVQMEKSEGMSWLEWEDGSYVKKEKKYPDGHRLMMQLPFEFPLDTL